MKKLKPSNLKLMRFYQINNNAILLINNLEFYAQIKYINTQVY